LGTDTGVSRGSLVRFGIFAMRRKSLLLAVLVVFLLLAGVGATLAGLVLHEPAYYRRGSLPAGPQRRVWSDNFQQEFFRLLSALQGDDVWGAQFTTEQINAYLTEGFLTSRADEKLLPENISAPRVALDTDRLRLGFRYGSERWSTVITIDMRLWVAQGQVNTVGLELLGLQAGALPISAQSLLEHVSEAARRNNVDVSWYRHEGHPVALLRFGADQPRTTIHLKHLELQEGRLLVQGRSLESANRNQPPAETGP
jgi:hypothetical protein